TADLVFETCNQGCSYDHDSHAERYRHDGNTNDQAGKIAAAGKSNAAGQKEWKIQNSLYESWVKRIGTKVMGILTGKNTHLILRPGDETFFCQIKFYPDTTNAVAVT
ncbi:MAG TPA: hypothetical protein PLW66_01080, partial [Saprospiraceae bacterium]|nr:hypothetical protein [Saprospiraceae bacterium]